MKLAFLGAAGTVTGSKTLVALRPLVKPGFTSPVVATPSTIDVCGVLLPTVAGSACRRTGLVRSLCC